MLHGTLRIFSGSSADRNGLGTLQDVCPSLRTVYDGLIVNHSPNDYAELLSDTGLVGVFAV